MMDWRQRLPAELTMQLNGYFLRGVKGHEGAAEPRIDWKPCVPMQPAGGIAWDIAVYASLGSKTYMRVCIARGYTPFRFCIMDVIHAPKLEDSKTYEEKACFALSVHGPYVYM
jgi:hypothetical protein